MKISIPATSANIGIGFDILGLSFNLFNTFEINLADEDVLIDQHSNIKNHLVYKAYTAFLNAHQIKHIPISIKSIQTDVAVGRGLGSSSTCILAGVFAANYYAKTNLSFFECVSFAADYEGHPDNIFAAAYGGLVTVYKDLDSYLYQKLEISDLFKFTLLVPNTQTSTREARKAIPEHIMHKDAIHNLSRIIRLPETFKEGNFDLLKKLLDDKLHEPYRYPFIVKPNEILKLKQQNDLIVTISGSGGTLLVISTDSIDKYITDSLRETYQVIEVQTGSQVLIK